MTCGANFIFPKSHTLLCMDQEQLHMAYIILDRQVRKKFGNRIFKSGFILMGGSAFLLSFFLFGELLLTIFWVYYSLFVICHHNCVYACVLTYAYVEIPHDSEFCFIHYYWWLSYLLKITNIFLHHWDKFLDNLETNKNTKRNAKKFTYAHLFLLVLLWKIKNSC